MNTAVIELPSAETLFNRLNPQQKEAVSQNWGSSLVIAGAGSGKTTVLTRRVAYLVSVLHQSPGSILSVTFTNKAAAEMRTRLESLLGEAVAKRLFIGTFHSICARLLRTYIDQYKCPSGHTWKSNFAIYDETDSLSLVKDAINRLNLDDKVFAPKDMRHQISALKNEGYTAHQYSQVAKQYRETRIAEIFNRYQETLSRNNALDFDDLILIFSDLLASNTAIRDELRERFRHILVDEFQDTNQAQYKLIRNLTPTGREAASDSEIWHSRSFMVVGDVDQSIYSWRKADFKIILGFQKDYASSLLIKLEENYRSTATILETANSIIQNNSERIDKTLRCNKGQGGKIRCYAAQDEIDEAYFVAEELKKLRVRGLNLSDCVILYRTNAQSRAIEEVLIRSNVPYLMLGGTRFYDRAEIKDIIAYLKLVFNADDGQSFLRVINTPRRGIGKSSLDKLAHLAAQESIGLLSAAFKADRLPDIPTKAGRSLVDFALMHERWQNLAAVTPVSGLLDTILKQSGYIAMLEEDIRSAKDELALGRLENVRELLAVAKEFESTADEPDLEAFLTRISLVSDTDALKNEGDAVKLMTLHSAKGLEYQNVFLLGLEEGLLPHVRSLDLPSSLEEERRLMYVGVTRAEERLYLTYARRRASYQPGNYGQPNYSIPSRFLSEITPDLLTGFEAPPAPLNYQTQSFKGPRSADSFTNSSQTYSGRAQFNHPQPGQIQARRTQHDMEATKTPPRRVLGRSGPVATGPRENNSPTTSEATANYERFKVGDRVMHPKFGVGKVSQIIGENDKEIYNVDFETAGKRILDPRFAKLIKLD